MYVHFWGHISISKCFYSPHLGTGSAIFSVPKIALDAFFTQQWQQRQEQRWWWLWWKTTTMSWSPHIDCGPIVRVAPVTSKTLPGQVWSLIIIMSYDTYYHTRVSYNCHVDIIWLYDMINHWLCIWYDYMIWYDHNMIIIWSYDYDMMQRIRIWYDWVWLPAMIIIWYED